MTSKIFTATALSLALCGAFISVGSGCKATGGAEGETPSAQRATITTEAQSTLSELYTAKPGMRDRARSAAGWGYFSNTNLNVLLLSSENGYGVVHDGKTGKDTYMKMAGAGVGLGMGAKDYRVVIVFTDPAVMKKFVESGWDFGGSADATATADGKGGANNANASAGSVAGMEVYQFTKAGLALQATLGGTKYWRDDKLN